MLRKLSEFGTFFGCAKWPECDIVTSALSDGRPSPDWSDGPTREARKYAHSIFDQIWKSGKMKRSEAYNWLTRTMRREEQVHIRTSSKEDCEQIVKLVKQYFPDAN